MKDSFGTRLKFFRSKAGLSQQKLADKCGLSRKIISDYEVKLDVMPRDANLYKISDALNIDSSNLVPKTDFENSGELQADGSIEFTMNLNEYPRQIVESIKNLADEKNMSVPELFDDLINKALVEYIERAKNEVYVAVDDDPIEINETSFLEFLNSKT